MPPPLELSQQQLPIFIELVGSDDNTSKTYTAGEKVVGNVWISTKASTKHVTILFRGWCRSATTSDNARYSLDSTLFAMEKSLFDNSDNLSLETSENASDDWVFFPFEFQFPNTVGVSSPKSGDYGYKLGVDPFEDYPGHPLPPTYRIMHRNQPVGTEYYVKATMKTASLLHSSKSHKSILSYIPPCNVMTPNPAPRIHSTSMPRLSHPGSLNDRNVPIQQATDVRAVRNIFRSSNNPSSSRGQTFPQFALEVSVPTIAQIGDGLPVIVTLTDPERDTDQPDPPKVVITGLHVRLKQSLHIRLPRAPNAKGLETTDKIITKIKLCKCKLDQIRVVTEPEGMNLADMGNSNLSQSLSIPASVIPSFSTYGLALTYDIKVTMDVEYMGKKYNIDAADHGIVILPSYRREVVNDLSSNTETRYMPPPYTVYDAHPLVESGAPMEEADMTAPPQYTPET